MSSIAYITDKNMIEFHRLNGNKKLNFWRPSATTKFSDFQKGDLLFFLAKGTEKNKVNREKGIIGYGQYDEGEILTPKIAWNRYEKLNGYHTKEEFFEAILKMSKKEQLPDNIGCLVLDKVVFFQSPIYLSEIGINLSNHLESYFYLEKESEDATYLILEKAKEVGIDLWSLSFDDGEVKETFELANKREMLRKVHTFLSDENTKDIKQQNEFSLKALKQLEEGLDIDFIKGSKTDLYYIEGHEINILVPAIEYGAVSKNGAIIKAIGKLFSYQALLTLQNEDIYVIKLKAILDIKIEEGLIMWIENSGIEVVLISD